MKFKVPWMVLVVWGLVAFCNGQNKALFEHLKKVEKKQKNYNKLQPGWNLNLSSTLTVTQTAYHQWAAGGSNVLVWVAGIDGTAILDTVNWNWANESKILFGKARQNGEPARKTDDLIDLESVLTYKKKEFLNPYISLNLRTQMAPGYKYEAERRIKISDFFDPAYFTSGVGVGYSPKKTFRTRIGLAAQTTFAHQFTQYAKDKKWNVESGIQWVTHAERRFWEKLLIRSRLNMFSSFEKFEYGNIFWDTLVQASITKYIIVNIQTLVLYDAKVSKKTQLKEVLSIGIKYTFI
ncbi:hypothetical protein Calab_2287 [Caldithrix abyssi DSM 13497]|uniref:DUF3078 domain-containing protein n=1 Tax=Caldithrix abyssi DSM 13497 TaxID=880073 RepID=H1XXB2_CALAY|nr:DUF3078 domain-containing protein [Caldithrix abyssi]APF17830.1 Protein of unknown function (DUF3078) [Caldithrix abyssi DSM 13497]EHO41897.1 hypothetical protein Calab_2287 [Caldithrix abyssi DSM 13497]